MFQRIVLAYGDSPESRRALASAIQLVKTFGAELHAVIVMQELPVYTTFVTAADSSLVRTLSADRQGLYEQLQVVVREIAQSDGVELKTELLECGEVDAILQLLHQRKADLVHRASSAHFAHIASLEQRFRDCAERSLQRSWSSLVPIQEPRNR